MDLRREPVITPVPAPVLTVVSGLPGSGKTTYAAAVARQAPAVRFSPDEWLEALGLDVEDSTMRDRVEDLQRDVAAEILRCGASVVMDWGAYQRVKRDGLRELARSQGSRAELVFLDAPLETLRQRVRERGPDSATITAEQLAEWDAELERVSDDEASRYDRTTFSA